jgi:NADPH:quinone reductase-like Zn-dependent oxidoreductase
MSVTMKANRIHVVGGPEVILFEDVPRPTPATGEVLVRIHAAGVGPWDAWVRAGRSAVPQPLPLTLGADLAGTVEATGSRDSPFSVDDEVFGVTNPRFTGAYAQYALAFTHMLAHKPSSSCASRWETLDRPTRCWTVCGRGRPAKSCSTHWATHNIAFSRASSS